jgi:hypothetical protein
VTNSPYIEVVGGISMYRSNLTQSDLRLIGDFSRWRVAQWLYNQSPEGGTDDFHAVCGDIDIPWDTEEARSVWNAPASSESTAGQPVNPAV